MTEATTVLATILGLIAMFLAPFGYSAARLAFWRLRVAALETRVSKVYVRVAALKQRRRFLKRLHSELDWALPSFSFADPSITKRSD